MMKKCMRFRKRLKFSKSDSIALWVLVEQKTWFKTFDKPVNLK